MPMTNQILDIEWVREHILTNILDASVEDAAWYYAEPYEKAKNIKDHIAFCMFIPPELPSGEVLELTGLDTDKSKIDITVR